MIESKPRILMVGTVSNVEKKFRTDFESIDNEFSQIGNISYFFVESDSTDDTKELLESIKTENTNFDYVALGILKFEYPDRIERIRFCRNRYVEEIRSRFAKSRFDFVVVADLDGMNSRVTAQSLQSTLNELTSWDALFANQSHGYYDVFALRCDGWVEKDIFKEIRNLDSVGDGKKGGLAGYFRTQKLRQKYLYSKMRKINPDHAIIQVKSGFGGLGIYKPQLFLEFDYSIPAGEEADGSEHITFHLKCNDSKYRLGIYPKLINNHFNEYNLNKHYVVRILRDFKRVVKSTKKRKN